MLSERLTVGVIGGRDPRGYGGVESVVRNVATHAPDRYEFVQYCSGETTRVEGSDVGTVRIYSDRIGRVRSKYLASLRASRDLHGRPVDLVHGHGDNAFGLSVFRPTAPYVMTFHGTTAGMYANVFDNRNPLREAVSRVRPLPELLAARQCDVAVACSRRVREELVEHYGIDRGKTVVVRNGVDTRRFAPADRTAARERLGLDPDRRYVLWVGTDPRRKALEMAVRAVEAMDEDVLLLVAGTDREDAGPVRYLGRVPDERMADLHSSADVQCLCSLYEGFPLVLLESLACGTPVVASPFMPGVDDGVWYATDHEARRYARLLDAVVRDSPDRDRLRAVALEHDWSGVAAEYADVYDRVVER